MIAYIENNYLEVITLFLQHIEITVISLAIAVIIALPLGVLLAKNAALAAIIMPVLSVIYTIPSLAMFALLIPVVGLGLEPAIIALVAYSLLILVRNVIAGFRSIDPAVIEAGLGLGLSRWQLFCKIEWVLALPAILGGVRIAAVSIIGIAAIASWINAGGLGVILFQGLNESNTPQIVWGTILVAGMALFVNYFLSVLESLALAKSKGADVK
ncbi:ABC transporter permease [Sporolactobacillus putidus]|uniref:Glycine/betaine ABC transporter permease n=1 Tax=Sporolactobacillus putidus TaxID=492735 RepID=A0A917S717_9BACL|nr:ABC transporter permease [Sporolactobacillus putidus]GGL58494.1 glycine/betaine ABC transporter permease [Sporolactobacillus putidus]